jgi:hypothetical protein
MSVSGGSLLAFIVVVGPSAPAVTQPTPALAAPMKSRWGMRLCAFQNKFPTVIKVRSLMVCQQLNEARP